MRVYRPTPGFAESTAPQVMPATSRTETTMAAMPHQRGTLPSSVRLDITIIATQTTTKSTTPYNASVTPDVRLAKPPNRRSGRPRRKANSAIPASAKAPATIADALLSRSERHLTHAAP